MLRPDLGGTCEPQHLGLVLARAGDDRAEAHPSGGHRAGLVEDDGVHAAGGLEDLRPLDEDPELRTATGADEQCGRRREAQRAGARDDQCRDRSRECHFGSRADEEPGSERRQREPDDDGHEHRGHTVGEALHVGFAGLGRLDELGHHREFRVGADPSCAHDEAAADVDGRTHDVVAGPDLDRNGLAGQHARVDGRAALDDLAVGGDLLARTDDEEVADDQAADRDPDLGAVADDGGLFRTQLQQRRDGRARALLRPGFEVPSGEDEHRHRRGDLEVDLVGALPGPGEQREGHRHAGHAGHSEEQGVQRPAQRREDADTDERVHRRRAMPEVHPRGPVERPRTPHRNGTGEREGQPLPIGELQRGDHRHRDDRNGQHDGDRQPLSQRAHLGAEFSRRFPGRRRGRRRCGQLRRVAGRFDRRDGLADGDPIGKVNAGLLGGVIDRRLDPRHPVQPLLDACGAGGAGHPADDEFDLLPGHRGRSTSS